MPLEMDGEMVDKKYILDNIDLLGEYDIKQLEREIKRRDLTRRLGVYVRELRGCIGSIDIPRMEVVLDLPVDLLAKQISDCIEQRYFGIDFPALLSLAYLIRSHAFRHTEGDKYYLSATSADAAFLLNFITYIVEGTIHNDTREANRWLEEQGFRSGRLPAEFVEFKGVKIKHFNNSRLDLKFPSRELADKCRDTLNLWYGALRKDGV